VVYPATPYKGLQLAELTHEWSPPEPLTQNVATTFVAHVTYGRKLSNHAAVVLVGYGNRATLTAPPGAADIQPLGPDEQLLVFGTRLPGGGRQLTWKWSVTPLSTGLLTVTLDIEPYAKNLPDNSATINTPIHVTVQVNPAKKALDTVQAAAAVMQVTTVDHLVVGEPSAISATLPLLGQSSTVHAAIDLTREPSSVPATIQLAASSQTADKLVTRWWVTPATQGPVDLVFTVTLVAQVGDRPDTEKVTVTRSVRAEAAPPSLWDRLQAPVLWLTPFVVLAGAIAGLGWGRRRRRAGAQPEEMEDH
jgi:hypothetical protein